MKTTPNLKLNRKAMMDDFFDLIFTVMISFFLLFFLNFTFQRSVDNSNQQSIENVADFKRMESALNNLRVQIHEGQNLEEKDITTLIKNSKILAGKTITSCFDYETQIECEKDSASTSQNQPDYECIWYQESKSCISVRKPSADIK